ncbi:MAG TPA: glycoside hydrolase family 2 protein [Treponemataceae bacterium]|nr:glycoside hydrolase family 2 protein [Treponemataceae bacterium]
MNTIDLGGNWNLNCLDSSVIGDKTLPSFVPGSLYATLLLEGVIEDPFYRENEQVSSVYSDFDWKYSKTFTLTSKDLSHDSVDLVFEGIDTIASITLNDQSLASVNDMHCTYVFPVLSSLVVGENTLSIVFNSPTKYMLQEQKRLTLPGGSGGQYPGFCHLRKSHSMSGWDWGPVLPDLGIWRPVYLRCSNIARIDDVYITQDHSHVTKDKKEVTVHIRTRVVELRDSPVTISVSITSPNNLDFSGSEALQFTAHCTVNSTNRKVSTGYDSPGSFYIEENLSIVIPEAQLWWPNTMGNQPLYEVCVTLSSASSKTVIDTKTMQIGLRTIRVNQTKDRWGESFALEVNGISFFAMGADYVPEDSLLTRNTRKRTERLIKSAAQANHNCIRVWGGANYPENDFYELCDTYGLIIWHDHMMACGVYELTEDFRKNIVREIIDNTKRIRHHASLGLWCGNNEQEEAWCSWGWSELYSPALKADYIKLYEEILPSLSKEIDPATFFWVSSPSSGGSFFRPNAEEYGDMHNWTVWHGLKPFTAYRDCYSRFMSEFGIESFPSFKTIESFTHESDCNIFSPVMENHQKCESGNAKCLHYISETYQYPKDFSSLVYASQLIQAEGIRYGVEHWRRNRNENRCMGAVYWQLNDCWPVASWASIDYFGRWKALHYLSKRFFEPVLISACEEGPSVDLHVTNETDVPVEGTVIWRLCDESRSVSGTLILQTGKKVVKVPARTDVKAVALDFSSMLTNREALRSSVLLFELVLPSGVTRGSVLFVKAKHFNWIRRQAALSVIDSGDSFTITVTSSVFARYIELETEGFDALFSDNYFDLGPGDSAQICVKKTEIFADSPSQGTILSVNLEKFISALRLRSIADAW